MEEISEILPKKVYLSGIKGAQNISLIKKLKINCIINVTTQEEFDNGFFKDFYPSDIEYFRVETVDDEEAKILKNGKIVIDLIKNNNNVLINCMAGSSRSATFVLMFLMEVKRLSLRDSIDKVCKTRSCICPNDGFFKQLINFEEELIKKKILPENTKRFSMEEVLLHKVIHNANGNQFLSKYSISNEEILKALKKNNFNVENTQIELLEIKRSTS